MTNKRLIFLDFVRMLSLWYMIFQHGYISIFKFSGEGFLSKINTFAPVCSALFLFISGFTLAITHSENKVEQTVHLTKRGLFLILSSSILFILENGFQFPDCIFASNILNTIGILTLLAMCLFLLNNHRIMVLSIGITILTILYLILDLKKMYFFPFSTGYEPLAPTIIFGLVGLLLGLIFVKCTDKNKLFIIITTAGILLTLIMAIRFGLINSLGKTGRYLIMRFFKEKFLLQNLFTKTTAEFSQSIWNFNYMSFASSLGLTLTVIGLAYFSEPLLSKCNQIIFAPGRVALINYFVHLGIFAVLVIMCDYNSFATTPFCLTVIAIILLSYPIAIFFEKIKAWYKCRKANDN